MKRRRVFLRIVLVSLILAPAWASAEDVLPKISFEQTFCDLGRVGLGTKNSCEFKFTNAGQGLLRITNMKSTCGCTVAQLDKKEYALGESGTIKVTYAAPNTTTATQKSIYVSSNDKANPNVRLTIKAEVVQIVQALPAKLNLSLREKNLGLNRITLHSLDNQPFSIKSLASTNCNCINADTDPPVAGAHQQVVNSSVVRKIAPYRTHQQVINSPAVRKIAPYRTTGLF